MYIIKEKSPSLILCILSLLGRISFGSGASLLPGLFDFDEKSTTMDPFGGETISGGQARGGSGCFFTSGSMSEIIKDKCVDLIGMRMENFPPRKEDLVKINYDDMCFSKCYLMEIRFLTLSDNFDRSGITNFIKRDTPQDRWSSKIQATNKCIKYTENMAADEGGVANSPCKYSLVFFMCVREVEAKMGCQ